MLTTSKATPILPPANIVPVKNVKLSNTIVMDRKPVRFSSGTSLSANSPWFDSAVGRASWFVDILSPVSDRVGSERVGGGRAWAENVLFLFLFLRVILSGQNFYKRKNSGRVARRKNDRPVQAAGDAS